MGNSKCPVYLNTQTQPVADLDGKAGGEIMPSAEREPIMRVWGRGGFAPRGVQGQSPW